MVSDADSEAVSVKGVTNLVDTRDKSGHAGNTQVDADKEERACSEILNARSQAESEVVNMQACADKKGGLWSENLGREVGTDSKVSNSQVGADREELVCGEDL